MKLRLFDLGEILDDSKMNDLSIMLVCKSCIHAFQYRELWFKIWFCNSNERVFDSYHISAYLYH